MLQLHSSSKEWLIRVIAKVKCTEQRQRDWKKESRVREMVYKRTRNKEVQKKRITGTLGGWCSGADGGKTQSSLSEDIYILQSAPWLRIVEFPLIKEEGNVFTIKLDAQNEWLGEAWACCSLQLSASPPSLMKLPEGETANEWKYIFFQCHFFLSFNMDTVWKCFDTLLPKHEDLLSIEHCVVKWPFDRSIFDFYCIFLCGSPTIDCSNSYGLSKRRSIRLSWREHSWHLMYWEALPVSLSLLHVLGSGEASLLKSLNGLSSFPFSSFLSSLFLLSQE